MSAREPWWARLIAALIDWWTGRQRELGRDDIRSEAREAAEAGRKDYDQITSDGRDLDTALGRLRDRAQGARASDRRLP